MPEREQRSRIALQQVMHFRHGQRLVEHTIENHLQRHAQRTARMRSAAPIRGRVRCVLAAPLRASPPQPPCQTWT